MLSSNLLKAMNFLGEKYSWDLTIIYIGKTGNIMLSNNKSYRLEYLLNCADGIEEWIES